MNGAMMPIFGFLLIKTLFSMFTVDKEKMYDETMNWILIMALLSVAQFFIMSIYKGSFAFVSGNITKNMREKVYGNFL